MKEGKNYSLIIFKSSEFNSRIDKKLKITKVCSFWQFNGIREAKRLHKEKVRTRAYTAYGLSKLSCTNFLLNISKQENFPLTILRLFKCTDLSIKSHIRLFHML